MSYKEKLAETGKALGISYIIGLAASVMLMILLKEFSLAFLVEGTLLIGSLAAIFKTANADYSPTLVSAATGMLRNTFHAILGAVCSLNPVFIVLAMLGAFLWAVVGGAVVLYLAICFPLNLLYLVVMTALEASGKTVSEGLAAVLDQAVPVISAVCTVCIGILVFTAKI